MSNGKVHDDRLDIPVKISVILSVYNGEQHLAESIESILAQTLPDFEFLIINDGSSDGSARLVKKFRDPRIRLIDRAENRGLTSSLNEAWKLAGGEFIARMDADDVSPPDRFEKQVSFLDRHEDHGIVGLRMEIIDQDGVTVECPEMSCPHERIMEHIFWDNPFVHSSLMMRNELLGEISGYDPRWRFAQDYDLVLRASRVTKMANLPEPRQRWRRSRINITGARRAEQTAARDAIRSEFLAGHAVTDSGYPVLLLRNLLNHPHDSILAEEWRRVLGGIHALGDGRERMEHYSRCLIAACRRPLAVIRCLARRSKTRTA